VAQGLALTVAPRPSFEGVTRPTENEFPATHTTRENHSINGAFLETLPATAVHQASAVLSQLPMKLDLLFERPSFRVSILEEVMLSVTLKRRLDAERRKKGETFQKAIAAFVWATCIQLHDSVISSVRLTNSSTVLKAVIHRSHHFISF